MADEINWEKVTPNIRHRNCPGCGEELTRFHLSALMLPIEQFTMRSLQELNHVLQWSIRPFAAQNINELQQLAFISPCEKCTLISTWDFGTEELDEILGSYGQPPFAQVAWNYAPDLIERHLSVAPNWLKPQLQALLDTIKPRSPNVTPSET